MKFQCPGVRRNGAHRRAATLARNPSLHRRSSSKRVSFTGEVYALYLLKTAQGSGLGLRLMQAAAHDLTERGMTSLLVWVLATNLPTRAFYEQLGGLNVASQQVDLGGTLAHEIGYGWPDTVTLGGL